jgi:hypothetical protein
VTQRHSRPSAPESRCRPTKSHSSSTASAPTAASSRRACAASPSRPRHLCRPGKRGARDLLARVAAWLNEANDRIPRLLAGAPSVTYDRGAFDAEAAAHAAGWTPEQIFGAFRRAADRYDAIIAESSAEELADSDVVMRWLRTVADTLMNDHFDDLDRLASGRSPIDGDAQARR